MDRWTDIQVSGSRKPALHTLGSFELSELSKTTHFICFSVAFFAKQALYVILVSSNEVRNCF